MADTKIEPDQVYEGYRLRAAKPTQRIVLATFGEKVHYYDYVSRHRDTIPQADFITWMNRRPVQHPRRQPTAA